jgi:fatty acid desaturase
MLPIDIAILTLLSTGLIFAIIELGLSAYWVSFWDTYAYAAPGIISFLLFASLWTALRTGFRLLRYVLSRRSSYSAPGREAKWVTVLGLVINAVTMIFWLSAFAAFDTELDGLIAVGIWGALLAFAIMLVRLIPNTDLYEKSDRFTVARLPRPPLPEHPDRVWRPEERDQRLRDPA